ncbi:MAG: hypothetical protein GX119_03090 [Syntrophomonadaceae bacterium]|jgi:hypothetical protein|nr:hypothetical protein [Syntrophomonadaceae bacterium]
MRKSAILAVIMLAFSIMIMGCQSSADKKPLTPNQQQTDNMQYENNGNMADRFEKLAEQVSGVKNATVAISTANQNNAELGVINPNPDTTPRTNIENTNDRTGVNQQMGNDRPFVNEEIPGTANRPGTSISNNIVVMVGLVLDSQNTDAKNIEEKVERKIKNADNRVSQVLFTTDGGMIEQINNINDAIRRGTPVDTIQRNLDRLTRSLSTNP